MDQKEILLHNAREDLKLNTHRICGKLRVCQEKRKLRIESLKVAQKKGEISDYKQFLKTSSKEKQMEKTLQWLEENFIRCPGVCLPRYIMYAHYLSFCQDHTFRPACAATFGKIIRLKFPELTTRRLGARGNSKYHYYGVGIKETSPYYCTVYSGRGLTRFSGRKLLNEGASRKIMPSAKSGTLLPEFPTPSQLSLPSHVEASKMDAFITMYRKHCQCILDSADAKNYKEINNYLVHFWHGIPKHLKSLFEVQETVNLICICDSIVYMVLNDILVPASLEEITDETLREVRQFAGSLEQWLQHGLKDCNQNLTEKKLQSARRFVQTVQRQISFLHLAKSFREVLGNKNTAMTLLNELDTIDIKSIGAQASYTTVDRNQAQVDLHEEYFKELKELLRCQSSVEAYIKWLENIFTAQVLQQHGNNYISFKLRAQEFLLSWSFFGARVIYSLTLNNSRTYGPFHLLHMMLVEYIQLIIETKFSKHEQMELQLICERLIKGTSGNEGLKLLKVITKSKFGAPKREGDASKKRLKTQQHDVLPSISTLKAFTNATSLPLKKQLRRQVVDTAFQSVVTLTPPSSPQGETSQRIETVADDVENLVDQHFMNCGINLKSKNMTASKTPEVENDISGFIQKFLQSQNQIMNPYDPSDDDFFLQSAYNSDMEEEESPLQSSFSQILKGDDFLFSERIFAESLAGGELQNHGIKDTLTFSSFINSSLMENFNERAEPSSIIVDGDEKETTFGTIDSKALQLSL